MKVLDLQCAHGHVFEGWFSTADDFEDQLARRLLECPLCGDGTITRLPSAPRLNLGAGAPEGAPPKPVAPDAGSRAVAALPPAALQAAWLQMVRRVVAETEDVGARFADEARRMHHGEAEARAIRGEATAEQTRELLDEGIPVMPLPLPPGFKGTLQ